MKPVANLQYGVPAWAAAGKPSEEIFHLSHEAWTGWAAAWPQWAAGKVGIGQEQLDENLRLKNKRRRLKLCRIWLPGGRKGDGEGLQGCSRRRKGPIVFGFASGESGKAKAWHLRATKAPCARARAKAGPSLQ